MILIIIMLLIVVFLFGLIELLFGICTYGDYDDGDDEILGGTVKIIVSLFFLGTVSLAIPEKDAEHANVSDRKQVEMPAGNIEGEVIVELKQRLSIVEDSVTKNRTDIDGNRELILRIVANDTLSKQEMLEKLNPDDCTVIDEIITCEIQ